MSFCAGVVALGFAVATGCGPTTVYITPTNCGLGPYEGTVAVLDELPADGNYIDVGTVSVSTKGWSWGKVKAMVAEEAASEGADAVVFLTPAEKEHALIGASSQHIAYGGGNYLVITARAIRTGMAPESLLLSDPEPAGPPIADPSELAPADNPGSQTSPDEA